MTIPDNTGSLPRETASELLGLLVRLEELRARIEHDLPEAHAVIEELADAADEMRRAQRRLIAKATQFEALMGGERQRYQELFDLAPDAYVVTSTAGLILEANAAASELLDRSLPNLLGKPLPVFVPPEDRRGLRRRLLQVARRPIDEFDLVIAAASGRRNVEARASFEPVEGGAPQVRWILRDVTARKAAEEQVRLLNAELERRIAERTRELAKTSERLASVLQEMPQGVLIVDAEGKVQTVNRRAEELTGMTAEELSAIGDNQRWRMFARDGRELEWDERPVPRAVATGKATLNERVHVERPDGVRFFFDFSATPVHGPDGLHSVIVTFQDVTAQELRERAERNFVTNAAHELQTPIAAITSGIQVLQAGAKDSEADRDRFLSHIAAACARLDRLTRALLVLARAQAGDEDPRAELVEVEPLLRSVANALPPGAAIEVNCPEDVAVIANRPLLEQALVNLGANAVKYTNGRVLLSAERGNGRVRLEVRDEGDGIDPVERPRVFDRFYRGRDEQDGFGLGLAIVAEAVKAIDGELELDSTDGGTGVSITLPSANIVHK